MCNMLFMCLKSTKKKRAISFVRFYCTLRNDLENRCSPNRQFDQSNDKTFFLLTKLRARVSRENTAKSINTRKTRCGVIIFFII